MMKSRQIIFVPKLLCRLIAASATLGVVISAHAEKALDEVIVTAQKKDETLQTVPMAVNAVTAETIAKYNLLDFKDIQSVTPGLTIKAQDSRTYSVALRGLAVLTDSVASPSVAIYWNEINYDIDSAYKAMYDVGQIEVLRGPQGTLRGITSPSGAITIRTKTPSFSEIEGTVEQSLGERSLSNTQFGVSLPLIEDKLAMRVAGVYDYNKTSGIENIVTGQENASLNRSGRVTLGLRATENLEAQLVYQYLESNTSGLNPMTGCGTGNVTACLSPYDLKSVAAENSNTFQRRQVTGLRVEWDLGPATLTSVTGYQDQMNNVSRNMDSGNAIPTAITAASAPDQQTVVSDIHSITQELRLSSNDADFYNWTYGLYGQRQSSNTSVGQPTPIHLFLGPTTSLGYLINASSIYIPQLSEGYAAFTNQSFQWTDKFETQVGVRYQSQRSHQELTGGVHIGPFNINGEGVTGSASASYQLTDDVRVYASYGRSYRGGGFSIAPNTPHDLTEVKPETSDSIELGFKSRLADGRVQINGDIYYQKYKDFLARTTQGIRTIDPSAGNAVANNFLDYNADAEVTGAELQFDALLTDDWQAGLGLSYTDAKLTGGEAPCNIYVNGVVQDPVGGAEVNRCTAHGRLSGEPNWSLSANSEYTMHFGAIDGFVRGLYTFNSGRSDDSLANSTLDTSSYGLFNLFVGARDPKKVWEVSVWAKNLFNHQQVVRVSPEDTVGLTAVNVLGFPSPDPTLNPPFLSGYSEVQVIPERQIGITGKYNFSL